nr:hypothetical protein [Tanacetum cinerariifolium]
PEEAPSEVEESHPLGSRVPLTSEEFKASEPSGTRTVSSHSPVLSNSTAPLSLGHPLTHVSPTPTPTRVSFHRRTTRMDMRTQPTLSPGMSACIAKAVASSHILSVRDTNSEEDELEDEDTEEDVKEKIQGLEDKETSMEEEEAAPEVLQQAVSIVDTAASEPVGLGYGAARHCALESTEEIAPSMYEVG